MNLNALRETINIYLFKSKERNLRVMNYVTVLISLTAIGSLIFYHGFPITEERKFWHLLIIKCSFGFYIFSYILRIVYDFTPTQFIRRSKGEGLLLLLVLIDAVVYFSSGVGLIRRFGSLINVPNIESIYILIIQLYFLVIIFVELGKVQAKLSRVNLSPPTMLIVSFIILILVGSGLLMLPEMTRTGESMKYLDALFTSISASCVTGLIVVDTGSFFSLKGQILILALIQLGGINIISFATLFTLISGQNLGIRHQSLIQENFSAESLISGKGLLRKIFLFSFIIEAIGSILIYLLWHIDLDFIGNNQRWFYSIFHSVSAFNNAGFSLYPEGLASPLVEKSFLMHMVIAALIVLGGLGFPVLQDIFSISAIRQRIKYPWKTYSLHTRITLLAFGVLIALGTIPFFFIEFNNSMKGMQFAEKMITSLFQSITTRTAGFNTVDIGTLSPAILVLFMFLMFIGAAPGSTGGGIKTTAFALIGLGAYSTIRGKKKLEFLRHNINFELLNKAYSILLFAFSLIFFGTFALTITEPGKDVLALGFEQVSAVSTVGLSTGITSDLSVGGRIIIMLSMFIGRIGTLSIAFALSKKVSTVDYQYPTAHLHVA